MNKTKFKGVPVKLKGDLPELDAEAKDFTFVKEDLSEGHLSDYKGKIKIIMAVPSLDTGVCQMETKRFNRELEKREGVVGLVVSKDLPFAMKRFCENEGIENVQIASDFRSNFSEQYNTRMVDGPLKGLNARAVFVVDKDNKIRHTQLTNDVTEEPDYDRALKVVDELRG